REPEDGYVSGRQQGMTVEEFNALLSDAHARNDYTALIDLVPYARLIGIECLRLGDDMVFRLPAHADNIGNPVLPALHGGVIAGFMELAGHVHRRMSSGTQHRPKTMDVAVDYLRAGHCRDTVAQCQVWRQGRRVPNVAITAWQTTRSEP